MRGRGNSVRASGARTNDSTINVTMIAIKVPPLGESIVEATVARWLKREGDTVSQGETLVELETDKITVEVPALQSGVLAKQAHKEGDVVKVGDELGEIEEGAGSVALREAAPAAPAGSAPLREATAAPGKVAPAARRAAAEAGIDPGTVAGSGRGGLVTKSDVVAAAQAPTRPAPSTPVSAPRAVAAPAAVPAPSQGESRFPQAPPPLPGTNETREPMSTRRKRIAENLLQAQHATAHLTTFNEVDMSAVSAVRARLKERVEKEHGVKLTYMPFFAKAASMALAAYPVVNAQIDGTDIVYRHYVNLGIAVASDQGLVVPVVKNADRKGMIEFSRDLAAVATRARDGKLTMDDLTGGTFTITNGGVFGSLISTPILNYPQVGILGLHKIQDRPVAIDGRVEIRPMMFVALSYDHRIVDGQQAVLFLVRVKELMEDPAAMLID
jgi:2-oxoglutarate dehydrogenase E2 component (dihydrolipoamide succinyltransferase)